MKCQICGRENASIHIREIKDGEKKSYYICQECAAKKSGAADIMGLAKIIYDLTNSLFRLPQKKEKPSREHDPSAKKEEKTFISGIPRAGEMQIMQELFGNIPSPPPPMEEKKENESAREAENILRCSCCGWGGEQLKKTNRMGCPHCYKIFAPILEKELKKMHRGTLHAGKYPVSLDPLLAKQVEEERSKCIFAQGKNEELSHLQRELENAVKQEEYENAAILRDKISSLQTEMMQDFFGGNGMENSSLPVKKKAGRKPRNKKNPPETGK